MQIMILSFCFFVIIELFLFITGAMKKILILTYLQESSPSSNQYKQQSNNLIRIFRDDIVNSRVCSFNELRVWNGKAIEPGSDVVKFAAKGKDLIFVLLDQEKNYQQELKRQRLQKWLSEIQKVNQKSTIASILIPQQTSLAFVSGYSIKRNANNFIFIKAIKSDSTLSSTINKEDDRVGYVFEKLVMEKKGGSTKQIQSQVKRGECSCFIF